MRFHRSPLPAQCCCFFAFLLAAASMPPTAAATTINFSDLSEPGIDFRDLGSVVTHDGIQFVSTPGPYGGTLGVWQDDSPNRPEGGTSSTSLMEYYGNAETTMTETDGSPFSLNAIDLAPYRVNAYAGTFEVTFVGTQADSSTVLQEFTVNRSNGATPALQRFYFSGFTNLVRVTWLQGVAPEA
jgi:hypothetical protein